MKDRDPGDLRSEISALRDALEDRTEAVDASLGAVSALSSSLEQLVARQRRQDRALHLNSFVAYLVFTFLLGGGFFLLYHSRAGDLTSARDQAVAERDAARERVRALEDERATRKAGEAGALEFYELLRDGKNAEAIAFHAELGELALSETERAVVDDGLEEAKAALVETGYASGVEAYRRGDYEAATADLRRALPYAGHGKRAAAMHHYLGVSLLEQGSPAEAVGQLELALEGPVARAGLDDTRYHLGVALAKLGRDADAKVAYERFIAERPGHRLGPSAWRGIAAINRAARDAARAARLKAAAKPAAKPAPKPTAAPKPAAAPAPKPAAAPSSSAKPAAAAKPAEPTAQAAP